MSSIRTVFCILASSWLIWNAYYTPGIGATLVQRPIFADPEAVQLSAVFSEAAYDAGRPLGITLSHFTGGIWRPLQYSELKLPQGNFNSNGYYFSSNAAGFVAINVVDRSVAIVFRGSDQTDDYLDAVRNQFSHYSRLLPMIRAADAYIKRAGNIKKIYITGHSLGGAMAELFVAKDVDSKSIVDGREVSVVTFGSPGSAQENRGSALADNVLRIIHTGDGIPKLGILFKLFRPGTEIKIDLPGIKGGFEKWIPKIPGNTAAELNLYRKLYFGQEHNMVRYRKSVGEITAYPPTAIAAGASVTILDAGAVKIDLSAITTPQLVIGSIKANKIVGGLADEVIYGGDGKDNLEGGGGSDQISGGNGEDVYVFRPGDGNDVIDDGGKIGEVDVISVYGMGVVNSVTNFNFQRNGNDLRVDIRDDAGVGRGAITVKNMVTPASRVERLRLLDKKRRQIGSDVNLVRVFLEAGGSIAGDVWARGYGFHRIPNPEPAAGDEFGREVALSKDGRMLAVGGVADSERAPGAGAAYVFRGGPDQWSADGKLIPSAAGADEFFGDAFAVAADGNTVLGGLYRDDGAQRDQGLAVVFERNATAWSETLIPPSVPAVNGNYAYRVGLADDGALGVVSGIGETRAYIVEKDGTGWHEVVPPLQPSYLPAPSQFGWDVTMSGDGKTCLVSDIQQGIVTAFRSTPGGWTRYGELTVPGVGMNEFGVDLSLSEDGRAALVGTNVTGIAYIFVDTGSGYRRAAELTPTGGAAGMGFGFSVDLSADGSLALIGAYGDSTGGNNAGAAYLFAAGTDGWTAVEHEIAKIVAPTASANAQFGVSVALSGDGMLAAIGSLREAGTDGSVFAGAAYVVGPGVTN